MMEEYNYQVKHTIVLDKNHNRIHISQATSGKNGYFCPVCGKEMVARKGEVRIPHFAHYKCNCIDDWHYNKGPWHLKCQNLFPLENQEVVLSKTDRNGEKKIHIADICFPDSSLIIEFQHSPIALHEFDARNKFYMSLNYSVCWIFDVSEGGGLYQYHQDTLDDGTELYYIQLVKSVKSYRGIFFDKISRENGLIIGFYDSYFKPEPFFLPLETKAEENIMTNYGKYQHYDKYGLLSNCIKGSKEKFVEYVDNLLRQGALKNKEFLRAAADYESAREKAAADFANKVGKMQSCLFNLQHERKEVM